MKSNICICGHTKNIHRRDFRGLISNCKEDCQCEKFQSQPLADGVSKVKSNALNTATDNNIKKDAIDTIDEMNIWLNLMPFREDPTRTEIADKFRELLQRTKAQTLAQVEEIIDKLFKQYFEDGGYTLANLLFELKQKIKEIK